MRQALRMLARDWRAGELRVLALALVIAVASVTSVAFFADRVSQALVRDAYQLLGADLVLVSDRPWTLEVPREIARRGLAGAAAANFISMAIAGERSQLAGVIELLFELNKEYGTTLVMVTHDESLASRCTRIVRLAAGRIVQ